MSAYRIIDEAPLGAIIRFSDGTPRPPDRFKRKLSAWTTRNDRGRLVRKEMPTDAPSGPRPGGFLLHIGDFASKGIVLIKFHRFFQATSALEFEIEELPPPGSFRILRPYGDSEELEYLAPDAAAADVWLARNHLAKVRLDTVSGIVGELAA
jgi:hypothetical protein